MDMLGSTRAVVEAAAIAESYDPEPWGLFMPGRTLGSGTKEGFTGKERDSESGLDYFGARLYMGAVARWTGIDPLAEKHPEWSPYNYVLNNPIALLDPDGRQLMGAYHTRMIFTAARAVGWRTPEEWDDWGHNTLAPAIQEFVVADATGRVMGAAMMRLFKAPRPPVASTVPPMGGTPRSAAARGTRGRAGQALRKTSPSTKLGADAAETRIGTRYMGPEEAEEVRKTGTIPAVNKEGEPKNSTIPRTRRPRLLRRRRTSTD
jgi:RHS repeat-associated protein